MKKTEKEKMKKLIASLILGLVLTGQGYAQIPANDYNLEKSFKIFSNLKHQRTLYKDIESDTNHKYDNKVGSPLKNLVKFLVYEPIDGRFLLGGWQKAYMTSLINTSTNETYTDTPILLTFFDNRKFINKDKVRKDKENLISAQILLVTGRCDGFSTAYGAYCMKISVTEMVVVHNIVEE